MLQDMDNKSAFKYIAIFLLVQKSSSQLIVEDFVTDTCTFNWPSTGYDSQVHMLKGKYYISTNNGGFSESRCNGHWPAKIRNPDDFEAYKSARRDKDYFLHLKLTANARDNCQQLRTCNGSFAHRDDNSEMYLYDWMDSAKVDTAERCVKFKGDTKIETESCYSDKRQLCLVKCIPRWPNCVIKESNTYRYDVNSPSIVSKTATSDVLCANLCRQDPNCIYWTRKSDSSCKLIPLSAVQPWLSNPVSTDYHERATRYCIPPITCGDPPTVTNTRITHNDTTNKVHT